MKAQVVLTACLVLVLAGCSLRGKSTKAVATAPPPPLPLSLPQTHVELPKPQPLDPAALATEDPPAPETPPPAEPPAPRPAPRPAAGSRRNIPAAGPPAPTGPPVAAEPAAEPVRAPIQEIVPPTELKRLQEQAQGRRRESNQVLLQLAKRQLTRTQRGVVANIRSFLALSEEAEKRNDMRQADALAERAQILAMELQSGK